MALIPPLGLAASRDAELAEDLQLLSPRCPALQAEEGVLHARSLFYIFVCMPLLR